MNTLDTLKRLITLGGRRRSVPGADDGPPAPAPEPSQGRAARDAAGEQAQNAPPGGAASTAGEAKPRRPRG